MENSIYFSKDKLENILNNSTDQTDILHLVSYDKFGNFDYVPGKKIIQLWGLMIQESDEKYKSFDVRTIYKFIYPNGFNGSSKIFLKQLFDYLDSISSPSLLTKWMEIFYKFPEFKKYLTLPNIEPDENYFDTHQYLFLPNYTLNRERLSLADGSQPFLSLNYQLNFIDPIFTGYFLENLFYYSYTINLDELKEIEGRIIISPSIDYKLTNEITSEIEKLSTVYRSNDPNSLILKQDDKKFIQSRITRALEKNNYPIIYSSIIKSFSQYINKKLSSDCFRSLYNFLDFFDDNLNCEYLLKYFYQLSKTGFVYGLRKFKDLNNVHGRRLIMEEPVYLSGEIDFKFPNMILDTKAYKNEELNKWASQLYLYKLMNKNKNINCVILNFLNNTIYEYKFQ